MTQLSTLSGSETWLSQFAEGDDREAAASLADEIHLVSAAAFQSGLRALIDEVVARRADPERKIALYAERPVKLVFGKVPAFFKDSRKGRATGPGVQPVIADPRDQEVGSEGVVAQLITDYCRLHPEVALSHPGPTKLRKDRVGDIVIVTDFIGSGRRVHTMLESMRYVASLRSWRSYRLLRFTVAAYSGTPLGLATVGDQKLKPTILTVMGCPTLFQSFRGRYQETLRSLCRRYSPQNETPYGFENSGALLAFAHGCPNNAPPILWSRAKGWTPLFQGRTTTLSSEAFSSDADAALDRRAEALLGVSNARDSLTTLDSRRWLSTLMVLAASEAGARKDLEFSGRTGLPLAQVTEIASFARIARWLTASGQLTPLGRSELDRLRRRGRRRPALPTTDNPFYYPSQLRAP